MRIWFYATLRQAAGVAQAEVALEASVSVRQALQRVETQFPGLRGKLLMTEGALAPWVTVFVDGRDVRHLPAGLETALTTDEELTLFPPVAGGVSRRLTMRGLSPWLLRLYLQELGAREEGDHFHGDGGWSAGVEETMVPIGALSMNEITVTLEGPEEVVGPVYERLRLKTLRGGG